MKHLIFNPYLSENNYQLNFVLRYYISSEGYYYPCPPKWDCQGAP